MGGFVVIDKTEFSLKLKRLCQSQGFFHAWKRGEKPVPLALNKVEEKGSGNLLLHFPWKGDSALVPGQEFLFYFIQNSIQYFSHGQVVKTDEAWGLEVTGEVYKREKRKDERLLTFPHHQVFAYFSLKKEGQAPSNVVFLDKGLDKKKSFFEKFIKRNDPEAGLTGFRVLDVSLNGFSFTASRNEKALFMEGSVHQVRMLFNGHSYDLAEVRIVHAVDYIDPRFGHVPMFKLGVEIIKGDSFLTERINVMLGNENKRVELSSEFENLFK